MIQASHSQDVIRSTLVSFGRPDRSRSSRARSLSTHSFGDCVLDGAHAHACLGGDPTDWKIAEPVVLHLARDNEEHGAFAFGVPVLTDGGM